jgi:hypothetical protein
MGYFVERVQTRTDEWESWRLTATNWKRQRWIAEHEDLYQAALLLAEMVNADVEG